MREILRRPRSFQLGHDRQRVAGKEGLDFPEDIWTKCPKCSELLYVRELENNLKVCQKCGYHLRLTSAERVEFLADPGTFQEVDDHLQPVDAIGFVSLDQKYAGKLNDTQAKTQLSEAVVYGTAEIDEMPAVLFITDFRFFGGSMGSVYGERLVRAAELAARKKAGLVSISASGGARMQEGIYSLMQMAKTNAALANLSETKLPHISVLTDPCTGGVTASYASVADVVMAEPGALIGFAGPRVIEQTIKQKLPADFQSSEFLLKHGMLDMVTPRRELKSTVGRILRLYRNSDGRASISRGAAE